MFDMAFILGMRSIRPSLDGSVKCQIPTLSFLLACGEVPELVGRHRNESLWLTSLAPSDPDREPE